MNRFIKFFCFILLPLFFSCTEKELKPQVIPVESVSLNHTTASITIGETLQLTATVLPEDATEKAITWTSSDDSVATIEDGNVKAIKEGQTIVTAKAGGKQTQCTVSVLPRIRLNTSALELTIDDTETLTATLGPSDVDKKIAWSSSDSRVAKVEEGKITALAVGSATITATLDGYKAECVVTVKGLEYQAVSITDLKPVEILPVIGQVTNGDRLCYDHIEHLRLAEATRIRDMMWEYGAGNHSKEEYRQLMGRLSTGMTLEIPLGYNNYTFLGDWNDFREPSNHAHVEWFILNTLVKYANFIVVGFDKNPFRSSEELLLEYEKNRPNSIIITGNSSSSTASTKKEYDLFFIQDVNGDHTGAFELYNCKNYIHFAAGTNIEEEYGSMRYKIFNGDYEADENGNYSTCSMANSDKNTRPESHLLVTIATDKTGEIHVDEEPVTGTKFPIGFAGNVLFAGRPFPYHSSTTNEITAPDYKPNTSFPNYVNVALMDICFQLYAEVRDADALLDMVRSTCLTDYVRLGNQTQPLQLINPAGLYKKYLTPQSLPDAISTKETLYMEKGYYKGVIFSIPGAEVGIDGEWVAFDNKNKDTILAQNPMNLEWRLNGDLLRKMGYSSGQTVEGQISTVDDNWGGLRLEVPMTIVIK